MNKLTKRFKQHVQKKHLLDSNKPLLIGLSGGADSVCLFHLLLDSGYSFIALHCNFNLRGEESLRDEEFVRELCKRNKVTLLVKQFNTKDYIDKHKVSLEMGARELRYTWFNEVINETGAQGIAIAHHQDDQAETLLLNLIRGTGIKGLAGMSERNVNVIRPLLPFNRKEILEYLQEIHQDYITDSSNLERDATRNKIRLDVIPLLEQINPKASVNIANAANRVRETLPNWEKIIDEELERCRVSENEISIQSILHSQYPQTVLYEWLSPYGFNQSQVSQILDNLEGDPGAIFTSNNHKLLRNRNTLILKSISETGEIPNILKNIITVEQRKNAIDIIKELPLTPKFAYLDAGLIENELTISSIREGMRFHPFGMKGSKLISDFLTDLKLNRFEKENQKVLCDGDNVVWIIGLRADNRYRVTENTKHILQLQLK